MDDAERWLQNNDPIYGWTSQMWRQQPGDERSYRRPRDEDLVEDITLTADDRGGSTDHIPRGRLIDCTRCGRLYEPYKSDHRFCGDLCRAAHRMERRRATQRELMRRRRAA